MGGQQWRESGVEVQNVQVPKEQYVAVRMQRTAPVGSCKILLPHL